MWTPGHELKYWNKNGIKKGKNFYRNYIKVFNLNKEKLLGKKIADIGCGPFGGIFCLEEDLDVYPIDFLAGEYNKIGCCKKPIIFGDLNKKLPFDDNYFDVVVCTNCIDHIPDIQRGFDEIFRVLKDGGQCFIHVHLRTKEQINKAHVYVLDKSKVEKFLYNFKNIHMVEDSDWVNDREDRQAMYIIMEK